MDNEFDLVIRNATFLVDGHLNIADIGIYGKKIKKIEKNLQANAKEEFDASGLHVFPGVIDSQVHFREPGLIHKEDLYTGSLAAALGGVTTFLEMPNTNPPTTTVEAINEKVRLGKEKSIVNFGFFIGATGNNLEELQKSQGLEGCCGVKIFLGSSTGSLLLFDREKLLEIFKNISCPIAVHSESETILNQRKHIRDNAKSVHAHYEWRNVDSAVESTKMILSIAKEAKRKVHLLHITTKDEMELIEKDRNYCTVEVTPQHLTLYAPDIYDIIGTFAQMNPPIREKVHTDGLWQGLNKGLVDVIGSDHAPHTTEEKNKGYPDTPSGMPGVQTIFQIMLNHHLRGKISLEKLQELLCETPAKLYGLNKGKIAPGYDADFSIADLKGDHLITNEEQASKCGWTPYNGMKVKGRIVSTIVMGSIVMLNGKILHENAASPIIKKDATC